MLQKIRFFDKKDPKISLSELLSWMTIFKSIYMAFYVNTSWACALFRNNKQYVVLGQKRNCQRVGESELWRIQRERWIEVKYLPNGTNAGYMLVISWTVGTNSRKCYASKLALNLQICCLIGKPNMFFPSFLNRFSYFMNLWWCLWSFSVDFIQYM
jgi:hypothetical protein